MFRDNAAVCLNSKRVRYVFVRDVADCCTHIHAKALMELT